MLISLITLIVGLILLVKGADYLVDGTSSVARRFGISSLVIGLTVVAFGTSAPELSVSLLAAFSGNADIALGNINGSNIANILLILGIAGLIAVIPVKSRTVIKELPFMLLAGAILLVLIADAFLIGTANSLSRADGLVLLGIFSVFMYYLALSARQAHASAEEDVDPLPVWKSILYSLGGFIGLLVGAQFTVDGAVTIAQSFGISEAIIAVTVVAIGTSLPELVTSIVAARKKETDIAMGNVVGSNIFNILFVLGVSATVSPSPIAISDSSLQDAVISFGVMALLLVAILWPRNVGGGVRKGIGKAEALVFLTLYAIYIAYIVYRG